jgi:hypothetical protein
VYGPSVVRASKQAKELLPHDGTKACTFEKVPSYQRLLATDFVSPWLAAFLILEIRFFQKIEFLKPHFFVKNQKIFIHCSPFVE